MKTFDIALKNRGAKDPEMLLAVLYGHGIEGSIPCMVHKKYFIKLAKTNGRNIILNCQMDDKTYPSLIKDIQKDVITLEPIHLDLIAVSLDQEITMSVKVNLEGDCIGIKNGGVLQQSTFHIDIKGKPIDLPESITIDTSLMDIGTHIKASDLPLEENISLITPEYESILTIQEPKIEMIAEEETPAEGEGSADAQESGEETKTPEAAGN